MASRHARFEILIHPEPVRDMGVAFSSEECVGVVFITIDGWFIFMLGGMWGWICQKWLAFYELLRRCLFMLLAAARYQKITLYLSR